MGRTNKFTLTHTKKKRERKPNKTEQETTKQGKTKNRYEK